MAVLTSNERLQRLEKLGMHALRTRSFIKAEELFRAQLEILKDFPYIDDVTLAMAINNLALSLEFQGKNQHAESARRVRLQIAHSTTRKAPLASPPMSLLVG